MSGGVGGASPQQQQSQGFAVTAPGRANVIGEHVDYMGGLVLPCAINFAVRIQAQPLSSVEVGSDATSAARWEVSMKKEGHDGGGDEDRLVLPVSEWVTQLTTSGGDDRDAVLDGLLNAATEAGGWRRYVMGAVALTLHALLVRRGHEATPSSLSQSWTLTFEGDVPIGAGMSSSAALSMAFVTATARIVRGGGSPLLLPPAESAVIAQQVEHRCCGVMCGIMDPFISAAGGCILLDCGSLAFERVPLSAACAVLDLKLVLVDSMVKHELADGAYNRLRQNLEDAEAALQPFLRQWFGDDGATLRIAPCFTRRAREVVDGLDFDAAVVDGTLSRLPEDLWIAFIEAHGVAAVRAAVPSDRGWDGAMYVATEAARTVVAVAALQRAAILPLLRRPPEPHRNDNSHLPNPIEGLRQLLGTLLSATHAGLRDQLSVSTPELNAIQEALVTTTTTSSPSPSSSSVAVGGRLMGGGFGGCVLALVDAAVTNATIAAAIAGPFKEVTTGGGAASPRMWDVSMDEGARVQPLE